MEALLRATARAESQHFWFRGFRRFVGPLLERAVLGRLRPRLLDCGCGTGANVELLGRYGQAYGFDLSMAGLRLGRAAGRTRPGGYVVINVAAMEVLRGDHSLLSREIRRYSRASLRALVERQGFEIVRLTYTNATLFAPMALARTLQRWRGLEEDDARADREITVPPAPVNAVLTALLGVESWWVRRFDFPFGSSLLCLARKPV